MDGSSYASLTTDVAPATGEPVLLDAVPVASARAPASWAARLVHPACVSIAAACHLALLALFLPSAPEAYGDGGMALEAIAVDVVDEIPSTAAPNIAASLSSPADEPVEQTRDLQPETQPADRDQNEPEKIEPPWSEPEPPSALETAALPEATPLPETPKPVEPPPPEKLEVVEPEPNKPEPPAPKETAPQPPPSPAQAGSLATAATGEASPGTVNAYGARIARLISQARPRGAGLARKKGRVLIAFAIEPDGRIGTIEVRTSSGHAELDTRALETLQKITFPPPAPDMSARQRNFLVPYEFR